MRQPLWNGATPTRWLPPSGSSGQGEPSPFPRRHHSLWVSVEPQTASFAPPANRLGGRTSPQPAKRDFEEPPHDQAAGAIASLRSIGLERACHVDPSTTRTYVPSQVRVERVRTVRRLDTGLRGRTQRLASEPRDERWHAGEFDDYIVLVDLVPAAIPKRGISLSCRLASHGGGPTPIDPVGVRAEQHARHFDGGGLRRS